MKTKTTLYSLFMGAFFLTVNLANAQFKSNGGGGGGSSYHSSGGDGESAFSIGGGVSYNGFAMGLGSYTGIGITAQYDKPKGAIRFSFNYLLGGASQTTSETAYSDTGSFGFGFGPSVNVNETIKVSIMHFALDAKHYFGDYSPGDGGFYAYFGIGLVLASSTVTYGYPAGYNPTYYPDFSPSNTSTSVSQLYLRGGLGYDIKVGNSGLVFIEAGINFPPNTVNGQAVDASLPFYYNLAAGYRYVFGR